MGNSFKYNEPVWDMIKERIPVSLYFGILSAIITYSVCIPLGVVKAIRHKSLVDNISSVLIFLGYSVPGFALGAVLVVYLGARLEWFPLCGLRLRTLRTWGSGNRPKTCCTIRCSP